MSKELTPAELEEFKQYFSDKTILIVDQTPSSRTTIARYLTKIGAIGKSISMAPHFSAAVNIIESNVPNIIITEYQLGDRNGLEFLPMIHQHHPNPAQVLFIMATGNSTQSAIAEAAEEEVDNYILKPFTQDVLVDHMTHAIREKMKPSPYKKMVEEAKALNQQEKWDESLEILATAIKESKTPSLAHYYSGEAYAGKKDFAAAEKSFKAGLAINDSHYKCLTGMADIYVEQNREEEAYDLLTRLAQGFPLNQQRLTTCIRLAIRTNHFLDIDHYYEMYLGLEQRNSTLSKTISAALVVAGKYLLAEKKFNVAVEKFKKAMAVSGRNVNILKKIIMALIEHDRPQESELFLKAFPAEKQNTPDYISMDYLIFDRMNSIDKTISLGRDLINKKNVHDPVIYEVLIRRSREAGFDESADHFEQNANKLWPGQSNAR